jgi:DNA (cytosine-5)-methyltransferase 1
MALFAGAGGACLGAKAAGYMPVCAIEYDPYAAALYRQNFGDHIREENILDTDPRELPDVEFLWASPSCQSYSTAKTNGKELQIDINCAQKVADIIRVKKPRYFALENVRGYVKSESFRVIYKTLESMGYNLHYAIYDAANWGIPQNRNRLILRASRDRLKLLSPTHSKLPGLFHQPWNGWYSAVADLLPSCKQTHLTERQIKSLENKGWYGEVQKALAVRSDFMNSNGAIGRAESLPMEAVTTQSKPIAILVEGKDSPSRDRTLRNPEEPCMTITANQGGGGRSPKVVLVDGKGNNYGSSYTVIDGEAPNFTITANMDRNVSRAVIIERVGYGDRDPIIRTQAEPSQTIRASVGCDERGGYRSPITALLEGADIRALDYRCLARLQSFPDWYKWGKSDGKNCRAAGNAVAVDFAKAVIESFAK